MTYQMSSKVGHIALFTLSYMPMIARNIFKRRGMLGLRRAIVALWATHFRLTVTVVYQTATF